MENLAIAEIVSHSNVNLLVDLLHTWGNRNFRGYIRGINLLCVRISLIAKTVPLYALDVFYFAKVCFEYHLIILIKINLNKQ